MADQPEQTLLPSSIPAAHFMVAATFAQFIVGFGTTRLLVNNKGEAQAAVEWPVTISLSPASMKELYARLGDALAGYEKDNGEIRLPPQAG